MCQGIVACDKGTYLLLGRGGSCHVDDIGYTYRYNDDALRFVLHVYTVESGARWCAACRWHGVVVHFLPTPSLPPSCLFSLGRARFRARREGCVGAVRAVNLGRCTRHVQGV